MKLAIHATVAILLMAAAGCTTDDQTIDTRPQFDREGNPNFDTEGNYQGCHGIGCEVDTPVDDDSD